MAFITGTHLPRRTFLRGMGAAVALPLLDAMTPAGRHGRTVSAAEADVTRTRVHRGGPRAARLQRVGREPPPVRAGRDGLRLRAAGRECTEAARAVPRPPDHRQQHRRAHGRGLQPAGDRRRPLPVVRRLPDPVPPEADAGLRPVRRHVARPALRAAVRPVDADAVAPALHREPGSGRRLHLQLLVRLHGLHQLVVAERAAADDPRPAGGLRDAVRGRGARRRSGRSGARRGAASSTGS